MPYTNYIKQACSWLLAASEYPTDALAVHMVRTMELSRRIHDIMAFDDLDAAEIYGGPMAKLTAESFIMELDFLQQTVPKHLENNCKFLPTNGAKT
jgi:putative component of membrane protein insertase Oxa1/YidC/SpoIIIJ protein YidD